MIIATAAIIGFTQISQAATTTNYASSTKTMMVNKVKHLKTTKTAAQIAAAKAKQQAIISALDANNYTAWVTAVGTNSPLLTKVTSDKFPQYDQAYQLRKQADAIMTGLGLQKNNGMMGAWSK